MILAPFRMVGRLIYAVLAVFFGLLFAVPKWILFGTRGSRQRQKLIRLEKKQLREARKARARLDQR